MEGVRPSRMVTRLNTSRRLSRKVLAELRESNEWERPIRATGKTVQGSVHVGKSSYQMRASDKARSRRSGSPIAPFVYKAVSYSVVSFTNY